MRSNRQDCHDTCFTIKNKDVNPLSKHGECSIKKKLIKDSLVHTERRKTSVVAKCINAERKPVSTMDIAQSTRSQIIISGEPYLTNH